MADHEVHEKVDPVCRTPQEVRNVQSSVIFAAAAAQRESLCAVLNLTLVAPLLMRGGRAPLRLGLSGTAN